MKNKVVRKLLMVGLSSSVVLTSTVGVTAASMDATTTDVVVENAAEDEVLTPVEGEEAVTEETSEEVAEEETTEETGEEVAEEETTEDTEETVAETKQITVTFKDEAGNYVGETELVVGVNDTSFNTSYLTVPAGWEVKDLGDVAIEENTVVIVRKIATATRLVGVTFVTEDGTPVGTATVEIGGKDINFNASLLTPPENYELSVTGDIYVGDNDFVDVKVRLKEKTIMVNYVLEDGSNVGTGNAVVESGANYINTSALTDVPYGYELASKGDINLNEDGKSVNIVVREKDYEKSVYVNYVDGNDELVFSESIKVHKDAISVSSKELQVPAGYELTEVGDLPIVDGVVTVHVKEKEYTKDVVVNYVKENGDLVLTTSIKLHKDATYFNTSILKDVPYGYELASVGDVTVSSGNVAYVVVREKEYTKDVVVNYVDEAGNPVYTTSIKLHKDETYFNTSILKDVPYGWELVNMGDIPVGDNNVATVVVREKEYTKDVVINYVDEEGNNVLTSSIKLHKDATYFNTSILKDVPYGWVLANVGDISLNEDGSATVVVREKKYTRDVVINYVDEEGNSVATSGIKLDEDATYFNTSILKDVPYGWELASVGDVQVDFETNSATVVVREKVYQRDVVINYVDEEGNNILTSGIKLDENATYFNTSILTDVPAGWELVNVGDIPVDFETNSATVVVRQKKYTKDVVINYVDEEGNNVATSGIVVDEDATYFNTSILTDVPYGWELANVGDITINEDNTANVVVREKVYQRDVVINYVDEEGNNILTSSIKLDENATYFNTSILTDVPAGWELASVGDIPVDFETNSANVVVREKTYQRDVIINYVDEEGNSVATSGIKLDENATYFNTSILTDIPYGWELANVGDIPVDFETNSANVVVRQKKYTKEVVINYVDEAGNSVATSGIVVDKDATYFNTSILTDVPYGWELANVGDITINEDNTANVVVREKEYQRDVVINYVDEEGNSVATSGIKLDMDATYFNTSILTDVPYGWELAVVGDIPVDFETNSANVVVRQKKYTRDVTVKYVTEDGEEVGTGALVVDENDTYINTSILTDVPEGYVIAIVGDLPIEDNTVVVTVRAEVVDPEDPTPTPDPEDPDQPVDPEDPDQPTDPDQNKPTVAPEKPNNNQNNDQDKADTNKSEVKTNNPKTGDATNTVPLVAGLLGSGSMIGLIQMLRRKKK